MPQTLYEKIWEAHIVSRHRDGSYLLYVDRHLAHEVDSPQAFSSLRLSGLRVRAPEKTLLVVDHNVSTIDRSSNEVNADSLTQMAYLADNARYFGLELFDQFDPRQGICHIVGPEQGFILPGTLVVCGDSHTTTGGAFGALAFGIGTSEAEHVFATQTIVQRKSKTMRISLDGTLSAPVSAKDLILSIIAELGAGGAIGYAVEFVGEAIDRLSMEGRMTVCNMSVEAGARTGLIAPDAKTFAYLKDRPKSPRGAHWNDALRYWETLRSDDGAAFDREIRLDVNMLPPLVTWGTSPDQVASVTGCVPIPAMIENTAERMAAERALAYMGLQGGERITDIRVDHIFIGSCTNSRIEDLREVARIVDGKAVHPKVSAIIVPGSGLVMAQAEEEGLATIFRKAGFEWRLPGCSMCIGMNGDTLGPKQRCASTSSRNFEHRQGREGRTHLVSPAMAAAAAIAGRFVDVRQITHF
jgi:3-isopropylmalate/(R)-2-methylmalate dehydratase large subunit